ncbi:MAG TPA: sialidase family protein [Blastocatellia bacterium]|nr:sialidase family protein [Blastocatellia bacterium]
MPSIFRITLLLFLLSIATADISGQTRPAQEDPPAREGSGQPNMSRDTSGRVFLSWVEKVGEKRHRLQFAVRNGARWSEPQTVAEGDNWFVNWADFPSLVALPDQTLVAHWLVKSAADTYAYDVNISRSTDSGRSWSKPLTPHRDGTKTEHGFVTLVPMADGRVGAVWLDGRNMKEGGHDGHDSHGGDMTLRFATIDARGRISEEALLDARVCECCQTSAAMTQEGVVAVYRDCSDKQIRDISIVRLHKGRWTEPRTLHADNWKIEGCPVNGPSVAASSRQVAVAWFTAANDSPRVNLAFSTDAGANFGNAIRVDDGSPLGRVEVVLLGDGAALVTWLERTEKGAEIRARRIRADGSRDEAIIVAESAAARASGFPQVVSSGDELFFAWTEAGASPRVRVASMRMAGGKK